MLCVNSNPWEATHTTNPNPWEKSTTANPEFLPETKQRPIHRKPNHSFVSPKPFLRFATVASTANTKKTHYFVKPKAPFSPVSFPADPPLRRANHTQKTKTPAFLTETKHSKPIHSNPYPANSNPFFLFYAFFTESGLLFFFPQKPNKTFYLVSVKKTQQTHALFLLLCNRTHMLSIPLHLFIFISFSSIASLPVEPDPPDVIFLLC